MNDGIFSRATSVPWMAPTAAQASNVAMIAAHHGQFAPVGCTSSATTTLPSPMTRPTDRSISPRSRTKISAIASSMYTVLCSKRLTRFSADRNFEFAIWKPTATTTRPRITGRTPLLPPRTRSHEARTYSPSDWAMQLGRDIGRGDRGVEGQVGRPGTAVPAGVLPGSAVTGTSSLLVLASGQTRVTPPLPRRDDTSISTAMRSTPPGRMYCNGVDSDPRVSRVTP